MAKLRIFIITIAAVAAFSVANSWAQSWDKTAKPVFTWSQQSGHSVPATAGVSGYSANLKLEEVNDFSGPCPDDFSDQCIVSCECVEFQGTGSGSAIGSATAEVELTLDDGDFAGDPDGGCVPSYGTVFISGSKDDEELDLSGTTCQSFGSLEAFIGGFDFDEPGTNSCDGAGTANLGGAKTQLKLKGKYRKTCD